MKVIELQSILDQQEKSTGNGKNRFFLDSESFYELIVDMAFVYGKYNTGTEREWMDNFQFASKHGYIFYL